MTWLHRIFPWTYSWHRIPTLPQEILDEIIDYTDGNLRDLKHCSLAFRSLRARAQKHIFRDIKPFTSDDLLKQFLCIIEDNPRLARHIRHLSTTAHQLSECHGLQPLFFFLLSAIYCHAPASSFELDITRHTPDFDGGENPGVPCTHFSEEAIRTSLMPVTSLDLYQLPHFPFSVLEACTRLTTLSVDAITYCTEPFDDLLSSGGRISALANVTSLELARLRGPLPVCLLVSCVRLKQLALQLLDFEDEDVSRYAHPRPQLEELTCRFVKEQDLKTLAAIVDLSQLKQFTCRLNHERGYDTTEPQYILDQCAGSLEMLYVDSHCAYLDHPTGSNPSPSMPGRFFDISQLRALQELYFITSFSANDNTSTPPSRTYILDASLATINPNQTKLQRVHYNIDVELDTALIYYPNGTVRLDMRAPPAFLLQPSWRALGGELVRVAGGRTLSVHIWVNALLSEESRESYDRKTCADDEDIFDETMEQWEEETFGHTVGEAAGVKLDVWGWFDKRQCFA